MIRLIEIDEDNTVRFTDERLGETVRGVEYAIQRFMIAFFNTPNTMVDAPGFGGGGKLLLSKKSSTEENRLRAHDAVSQAAESILPRESTVRDIQIREVSLSNWERKPRGARITVNILLRDAPSITFSFGA